MKKRRLILVCQPNLLGESVEHILNSLEDVELAGCFPPDDQLLAICTAHPPDLVVIADDDPTSQQVNHVMSMLLDNCPNLPIIRVKLDRNILLIHTSQSAPARMADLIEAIRQAPLAGNHA